MKTITLYSEKLCLNSCTILLLSYRQCEFFPRRKTKCLRLQSSLLSFLDPNYYVRPRQDRVTSVALVSDADENNSAALLSCLHPICLRVSRRRWNTGSTLRLYLGRCNVISISAESITTRRCASLALVGLVNSYPLHSSPVTILSPRESLFLTTIRRNEKLKKKNWKIFEKR